MGKPVIIVGLDGATFDLILPWIKDGKLPFLHEVMENGAYGELKSVIPTISPAAWSSFMTGVNPGKHGILGFFNLKRSSYKVEVVNSGHRKAKEFWMLLGEHGNKVGIVNVPLTYPPKQVNGFMITGMLTPPKARNFTYPPSFRNEINGIIGGDSLDPLFTYLEGEGLFIEKLFDSTWKLAQLCFTLIKQYKPDLFTVVFNGTDYIQHRFWHLIDPSHPRHKMENGEKLGNIILEYYQFLDGILREIYSLAGEDATLIFISDHGAGPLLKYFHINYWLLCNGFLYLKRTPKTKIKEYLYRVGLSPEKIYNMLLKARVGNLGFKGYRADRKLRLAIEKLFLSLSDIDWKRTKAFSIGSGLIYINLKGREPYGIVCPGEEYEKVRDEIISQLSSFKDPETGDHVVEKVYRKEELYVGPLLDKFPDLIILPKPGYVTFEECEFGAYSLLTPAKAVSGSHRLKGIILMKGPEIKSGLKIENARIIDVAPTVLYLFGVPIPSYMDGRPLSEAIEKTLIENSVENSLKESKAESMPSEISPFTPEEEEEIKRRLRKLGYIS